MKKKKIRRLAGKLATLFAAAVLITGILTTAYSAVVYWDSMTKLYSEKARQAAELAAAHIDGDMIGQYYEELYADDTYYDDLGWYLSDIKDRFDISDLYVFVPAEDRLTYIIAARTDSEGAANLPKLGDIYIHRFREAGADARRRGGRVLKRCPRCP